MESQPHDEVHEWEDSGCSGSQFWVQIKEHYFFRRPEEGRKGGGWGVSWLLE